MNNEIEKIIKQSPAIAKMAKAEEVVWINSDLKPVEEAFKKISVTMEDIDDAEARLARFAPFLMKCFPETIDTNGVIESPLVPIFRTQELLETKYDADIKGKLYLKKDSHLAIAGSIKARGGIYEVLKHTEELAIDKGLFKETDSYEKLADPQMRKFFSQYKIQVGSTGNLGMSIGIMSAAIGYNVIVHMSSDAKQWKKDMLRSKGVTVMEYECDFNHAVEQGRMASDADPSSYFIDDENSVNLFLGYAVAAKRLVAQLKDNGIKTDSEHPVFVYIPCGVGGAPGGVTFGLKMVFGDNAHVFFVEPTQAPCMTLGMASGLHSKICVQDIGLTGITHADGLAVSRPSGFVGTVMSELLSGSFTVEDKMLYEYMRDLLEGDYIFIEPSSCASLECPIQMFKYEECAEYIKEHGLEDKVENITHIAWATGGSLMPEEARKELIAIKL